MNREPLSFDTAHCTIEHFLNKSFCFVCNMIAYDNYSYC